MSRSSLMQLGVFGVLCLVAALVIGLIELVVVSWHTASLLVVAMLVLFAVGVVALVVAALGLVWKDRETW